MTASVTSSQKKINRRKSFEDFSERDQDASNVSGSYAMDKFRRPSEAAMLILKECKGDGTLVKTELQEGEECVHNNPTTSTTRQRKLSVCYGSNSNINQANNQSAGLPPIHPQKSQIKRKGEKHSWPNTAQAQLQAWQHLEELNADEHIGG